MSSISRDAPGIVFLISGNDLLNVGSAATKFQRGIRGDDGCFTLRYIVLGCTWGRHGYCHGTDAGSSRMEEIALCRYNRLIAVASQRVGAGVQALPFPPSLCRCPVPSLSQPSLFPFLSLLISPCVSRWRRAGGGSVGANKGHYAYRAADTGMCTWWHGHVR
jgi:hypothetical protein